MKKLSKCAFLDHSELIENVKINSDNIYKENDFNSYLFLQYYVFSFPVFHHSKSLQSTYNVVRVNGHFLTYV